MACRHTSGFPALCVNAWDFCYHPLQTVRKKNTRSEIFTPLCQRIHDHRSSDQILHVRLICKLSSEIQKSRRQRLCTDRRREVVGRRCCGRRKWRHWVAIVNVWDSPFLVMESV
ncbi:hypothetical protein U1Q18_028698 [Sarracenia purpurea var. burkii]